MALAFKDFLPAVRQKGFFKDNYEPLRESLQRANHWMETERPEIVNVETVVLPNVHDEDGSEDPALDTCGELNSSWHQFVRVWYKV